VRPNRFEQEEVDVFNPEIPAVGLARFLGEIDGSRVARVDLYLLLRTYVFGLGHWRDSLESRGQSAPPDEMSGLWHSDLAGGFPKPAGAVRLGGVKGGEAVEPSATAGDYQALRGNL
jgi:hypothetical protein